VEYVGLDGAADLAICDYAGERGFVMVTKDVDYDQIIALRNFNPKLIRLALGNTSNGATLHVLHSAAPKIIPALNSPIAGWSSWGDGLKKAGASRLFYLRLYRWRTRPPFCTLRGIFGGLCRAAFVRLP